MNIQLILKKLGKAEAGVESNQSLRVEGIFSWFNTTHLIWAEKPSRAASPNQIVAGLGR